MCKITKKNEESALILGDKLLGELHVAGGTAARRVVENGGQSVTGRLAEPDVARDDGGEHHVAKVGLEFLVNLVGEPEARVVHGEQETLDAQAGVEFRLDDAHR